MRQPPFAMLFKKGETACFFEHDGSLKPFSIPFSFLGVHLDLEVGRASNQPTVWQRLKRTRQKHAQRRSFSFFRTILTGILPFIMLSYKLEEYRCQFREGLL